MTFFNGRKKSKILMVTLMVMALLVTSAMPMTVFATGVEPGVDLPASSDEGTVSEGGDKGSPGETNNPGEGVNGEPGEGEDGTGEGTGGENPGAGETGGSGEGTDGETPGTGVEQPGTNMGDGETVNLMMEPLVQSTYGISLEVSVDNSNPFQGDTVTYTYVITNTENGELKNVKLRDRFRFYTLLGIEYFETKTIWTGTLAGGETQTVTYAYEISDEYAKNQFKNDAKVEGEYKIWHEVIWGIGWWETKSVSAKKSVTIDVAKKKAYDISFSKTAPATVTAGGTIEYTFTVENTGKKRLENIILSDPLFGEEWVYDFGPLDKGKEKILTTSYAIGAEAPGEIIKNDAKVTAFGKYIPSTLLGEIIQHINENIAEIPWILKLLGMDKNQIVQREGSCTVTVLSKPPTLREIVTFFVLKNQYDRPDEEKSQLPAHFTDALETLIITEPGSSPGIGNSHINEFGNDSADAKRVENEIKRLSSAEAYDALMAKIEVALTDAVYGSPLPEGDWYIDWYDFKWEDDGWHVDGDIRTKENPPVDPPVSPAAISLTKTVSPAAVTSKDATVTYTFLIENTGGVGLFGIKLEDAGIGYLNEDIDNLAVGETTTVAIDFNLSQLGKQGYGDWSGNTFTNVATVTGCKEEPVFPKVVAPDEPDDCITAIASAIVTYNKPDGPGPGPGPGPDNDDGDGGRRTSSTKSETTIPDQPTPAGPATDGVNILLEEEALPAGSLPKTGGTPALLLYGLGALLAGGGFALRRKENKEK